ncbi:MAG: PQQ-binding-like beta-propeller repeat protein, partial [Bryobacteraceae bacterium]|nr:PQQ-binding-like beta-propeller repeat protein [Bryobacteraceae bacterium]
YKDFPGSTEMDRGYSPSPVAYNNTILVKLGGANHAIVAMNPKDGAVIWAKHSFGNSPGTPVLVKVGTRDIMLTPFASEIAALDPSTGNLLWSHPHKTDYGLNITTPLFTRGDNIVTITSAYSGGARGIQLAADGTRPRELWQHNRLRVHFTSALEIDGYVYGSSGDFGPSPLTCVEVKTGKVMWQDRTFSKGNLVRTGDKTILLTEDGTLALLNLSPQGLRVLARADQITLEKSWTAPSLVGTTLYVRDRRHILALDLR